MTTDILIGIAIGITALAAGLFIRSEWQAYKIAKRIRDGLRRGE